jgi:6-phosphogluconolactonase
VSLEIIVCADLNALTRRAEAIVLKSAADAQAAGRRWSVALAGGSTPRGLYRRLAEPTTTVDTAPPSTIDWTRAEIFFGDERTVPPDHADSNYGMVRDALLSRAPIPAANVHRMQGEAADLDAAARAYEQRLRQRAGTTGPDSIPVLDLAILGMGADGHTASLFPGTTALDESARLCVPVEVPQLHTRRLTLTYPVFLRARAVLFLIAGADKAQPLRAVVEGPERPRELPSQLIVRRSAAVRIVCDQAAPGGLEHTATTKEEP